MEHFGLLIVETAGVPRIMVPTRPFMKVLIRRSVKRRKPFEFILSRVRVHKIHDHSDSKPMRLIHKLL